MSINARLERLESDTQGKTIIVDLRNKGHKAAQQALVTAEQLAGKNGKVIVIRRKTHETNRRTHQAT